MKARAGRTKHKASKRIAPGNSREQNKRLAQIGEFAEIPEFDQIFLWRWRSTFNAWCFKQPKLSGKARLDEDELNKEIGEVIGAAMLRGDRRFFEMLAEATQFLDEHFKWTANSFAEFGELLGWRGARFVDPVRATIAQEYFFHLGDGDEEKKSRKAFMPYIAARLKREVDARGAFAEAFDRACKDLGIVWR